MKIIFSSLILFCLAFPVFSQTTATPQRLSALSEAFASSVQRNTAALANFDARARDDGTIRVFLSYARRLESLSSALQSSGDRLDFLLRGNARSRFINEEHENFERLLRELESVRSEYDAWMRTVQ